MLLATSSRQGILYGLTKVHKQNVPIRPILSSINTILQPIPFKTMVRERTQGTLIYFKIKKI